MGLTDEQTELLTEPIAVLGLSIRINEMLELANVMTVGHLLNCCSEIDACTGVMCDWFGKCTGVRLLSIPNFGELSLQSVYDALAVLGFCTTGGRHIT